MVDLPLLATAGGGAAGTSGGAGLRGARVVTPVRLAGGVGDVVARRGGAGAGAALGLGSTAGRLVGDGDGLAIVAVAHSDEGSDSRASSDGDSGGRRADATVVAAVVARGACRGGVEGGNGGAGRDGGVGDVGGGQPGRVPGASTLVAHRSRARDEGGDCLHNGGGEDLGGDDSSGTGGVLSSRRGLAGGLIGRLGGGLVRRRQGRRLVSRLGGRLARGNISAVHGAGRFAGGRDIGRVRGTSRDGRDNGRQMVAACLARGDGYGRSSQCGSDESRTVIRSRLGNRASSDGGKGRHSGSLGSIATASDARNDGASAAGDV